MEIIWNIRPAGPHDVHNARGPEQSGREAFISDGATWDCAAIERTAPATPIREGRLAVRRPARPNRPKLKGRGMIRGLTEVAEGASGPPGGGVAVLDTGHLQQLLGHGGGDDTGTPGGGDEPHPDGAALAGHLAGDGVGLADLVAPEAAPDGHDGQLGQDDGTADGGGHLLGALDAEPDVAVVVANGDEGLEAGALAGPGLLLDGHDLEDLVLQGGSDEEVDDLELLRERRAGNKLSYAPERQGIKEEN